MKVQQRSLVMVLLLVILFSFPSVASAKTDEYGYNAQARSFKGTLENWEAFMDAKDPTPVDWKATDVKFIERKWDKRFDLMLQGKLPFPGAWQKAHLWEYPSDQPGWTWHQVLEVVYSPDKPIPGAMELTSKQMGIEGFYCVVMQVWSIDPQGKKNEIEDFNIKRNIVNRALHWKSWKH